MCIAATMETVLKKEWLQTLVLNYYRKRINHHVFYNKWLCFREKNIMLLNKLCLEVCLCNYEASILTEIAVSLHYLFKRIGKLIFKCAQCLFVGTLFSIPPDYGAWVIGSCCIHTCSICSSWFYYMLGLKPFTRASPHPQNVGVAWAWSYFLLYNNSGMHRIVNSIHYFLINEAYFQNFRAGFMYSKTSWCSDCCYILHAFMFLE